MYYRYKSKRRNNKIYRVILVALLLAGAAYMGNRYRHYIFFWKYNYTRLERKVDDAAKIAGAGEREERLRGLSRICSDHAADNMYTPEAHLLSGKVHFLLGEAILGQRFSEKLIYDGLPLRISENARKEFLEAIRSIKKGAALTGDGDIDAPARIMLARAAFYTGYYGYETQNKLVGRNPSFGGPGEAEDARFYAILAIQSGKADHGFEILHKHGRVADTVEGQLFVAAAYSIARRYTNAIMEYQKVLRKTSSSEILKLVHMNLGKLYYNQSLYNESLSQFTSALAIDARDLELKIWIGKNYSAMGNKIKAKAVWSEVLAADGSNEEVKKLLNPL
jgi:tetratricopeptide (TPR) repeat protein